MADAVFAVVQEGVTNAMRYAPGAPVTASVAGVDRRGAGRPCATRPPGPRGAGPGRSAPGAGLAGLAARAKDLGGTFEAGPCPRGGWRVRGRAAAAGPRRRAGAPADHQRTARRRRADRARAAAVPLLVLLAAIDAGRVARRSVGVLLDAAGPAARRAGVVAPGGSLADAARGRARARRSRIAVIVAVAGLPVAAARSARRSASAPS